MKKEIMRESTEPNKKTIYDLALHERVNFDGIYFVMRVPGGWLYEATDNYTPVFVPFNDEFKE